MTPPDRTGGAGGLGGASTADISPGPPVPPAGAVSAPSAPAGPQTTVGAVSGSAVPAVFQIPGVWGTALTVRCAHFVPDRFPRDTHFSRETGLAIDGFQALIDERGLEDAETLPKCSACLRQLRPAAQVSQ